MNPEDMSKEELDTLKAFAKARDTEDTKAYSYTFVGYPPVGVCPTCGTCPTCGSRRGFITYPEYPQPYIQW